jgi:hypothetical protein
MSDATPVPSKDQLPHAMPSSESPVTQQEIVSAIHHHAAEIARLTETWPSREFKYALEEFAERADAWHKVFEAMQRHNPGFSTSAKSGLCAVLGELERLYTTPEPPAESEQQSYTEPDGCPTEMAVLKRFWREHSGQPPPVSQSAELRAVGDWVDAMTQTPAAQALEALEMVTHHFWEPTPPDGKVWQEHQVAKFVNDAIDALKRPSPPPIPDLRDSADAVQRFAEAMKDKMHKKYLEGRGGWDNPDQCSIEYLQRLLREHIDKGDMVDVGNFAMMLWNRFKSWDDAHSHPTKGGE